MARSKNPKFITEYKNLIDEWDWDANKILGILPEKITVGSNLKVHWICSTCGYKWVAKVEKRVQGSMCPVCRRTLQNLPKKGNSLLDIAPQIAKEWNSTKNEGLTPNMVSYGSSKKVWWRCQFGHEWQATIISRVNGNGCPICSKELQTSYPEQILFYYLKKYFPDAVNRYINNQKELDIYIPSLQIGIEYDGCYYHTQKTREREFLKEKYFSSLGISVYRVKENKDMKEEIVQENNIIYYSPIYNYSNLESVISLILSIIFKKLNKNLPKLDFLLERDNQEIFESYISSIKANSISSNESLFKEWDYDRNKGLRPEFLSLGSGKKVWWRCKNGHVWQASPTVRSRGNNCPYCSNQKVLSGFNDLATTNPALALEWHPNKNGNLTPQKVIAGSSRKVWWKCKNGHEWQASLSTRNKGVGCPYCSNQAVLAGYNDLQTVNPELASEWHPIKNGGLLPNMVTCGSGKKVWWLCKNGHEWQANINHRNKGVGCPYCAFGTRNGQREKKIRVYNANDLSYYGEFPNAQSLCNNFGVDYNKKHSTISLICNKKKSYLFLGKYYIRYENDDELKRNL